MGAKLNFNTATFKVEVTLAPDVDDLIYIDWDVDGWSDGILDWESSVVKRGHTFPIQAIGGQVTSGGKLGSTFLLLSPWQIQPYEADHEMIIEGNHDSSGLANCGCVHGDREHADLNSGRGGRSARSVRCECEARTARGWCVRTEADHAFGGPDRRVG